MLLTVSMASIPCLSRQPVPNIKDLKQSFETIPTAAGTPALQYFNIRVTERLHRYRSLKRQWNEVASNGQYDLSKSDTLASITEMTPITHEQLIKDYITTSSLKEKDSMENDPLRSQIQSDLMQLRKLIKSRQKKRSEKVSSKGNTHHRPSGENVSSRFPLLFFKENITSSLTLVETHFIMIKVYFHFSNAIPRPLSSLVCWIKE